MKSSARDVPCLTPKEFKVVWDYSVVGMSFLKILVFSGEIIMLQ